MDFHLVFYTVMGLIIAGVLSYSAYRFEFLSRNGAWAAVFVGGFTFGLGGLKAAVLLVFFFLSTSLIPVLRDKYIGAENKSRPMRNWKQVLVNGGPGLFILLLNYFITADDVLWLVYAGMIAAVTADTWATELGMLSKSAPRKITTWKAVERGTSGAVSFVGFIAAFIGSLLVGIFALLFGSPRTVVEFLVVIVVSGFTGALMDSLLGATAQAHYYDNEKGRVTEDAGDQMELVSGLRWVDNDIVNLACALTGGLIAFLLVF